MKNSKLIKLIAFIMCFIMIFEVSPELIYAIGTYGNIEQIEGYYSQNNIEPEIMFELTDERSSNIKQFMLENNSHKLVLYNEDIHYFENGQWEEIDNTLVLDSSPKVMSRGIQNVNYYSSQKGNVKFKFADKTAGKDAVKIIKENSVVSWSFLNSKMSTAEIFQNTVSSEDPTIIPKNKSSVLYKNVYENVDIRYDISGSKLKENIILNSKEVSDEFFMEINSENAEVTVSGEEIIFENISGESIFAFEKMFMFDDAGEYSESVEVTLEDNILKIIPDKNWINSSERSFPITIDPSISELNKTRLIDTYIDSNNPTVSYLSSNILKVGSVSGTKYTASAFKLNEMPHLPVSAYITDAKLNLMVDKDAYSTSGGNKITYIKAHMLKSSSNWTSPTWNSLIGVSSLNPYSSDALYEKDAFDFQKVNNNTEELTFDITNYLRNYYLGNSNDNFGIVLLPAQGGNFTWSSSIYSNDYTETSVRPAISIDYISMKGIESYYAYDSFGVGNAGYGNINLANGNVTFQVDEYTNGENILPLSISHVFNTDSGYIGTDKNDIPKATRNIPGLYCGAGWKINQDIRINHLYNGSFQYYEFIDEDGTSHYFKGFESTKEIEDESGLGLKLKRDMSNGYHLITDSEDNVFTFDDLGFLRFVTDKNGNQNQYYYTDTVSSGNIISRKLSSIKRGNNILATFNGSRITDYVPKDSSVKYTYEYDSVNNWLSVIQKLVVPIYIANTTGQYSYRRINNFTCLEKIRDPQTGYTVELLYNNAGKCIGLKEYKNSAITVNQSNGQCIITPSGSPVKQIEYNYTNQGYTEITEYKDGQVYSKNSVILDKEGRLAVVMDENKNTVSATYGNGKGNKNKVTSQSRVQSYTENLLKNHSFENSAYGKWVLSGASTAYSAEKSYEGLKSLKITNKAVACQYVDLTPNEYYTLSAYVFIPESSSAAANIGFRRRGEAIDTNNTVLTDVKGSWQRITKTIKATASAMDIILYTSGANTEAYFDCIQLEKGEVANRYNIIENGDFSEYDANIKPYFWNIPAEFVSLGELAPPTDNPCYKLKESPEGYNHIYQKISYDYLKTKPGDTFTFGGIAKGLGASSTADDDRHFSIKVKFLYVNDKGQDNGEEDVILKYNSGVGQWQSKFGEATAKKRYKEIRIYIMYGRQVNEALFDNISMFREPFSYKYSYDDEGNMNSSKSADKKSTTKNLTVDGKLIRTQTDSLFTEDYSYDSKGNMILSKDSSQLLSRFTYDSYGNQLTSMTRTADISTSIVPSQIYYMRDMASSSYIQIPSMTIGNQPFIVPFQYAFTSRDEQMWKFETASSGKYTIQKRLDNNTKPVYLSYNSNKEIIVSPTNTNSQWQVTKNNDNSFTFKTTISGQVYAIQAVTPESVTPEGKGNATYFLGKSEGSPKKSQKFVLENAYTSNVDALNAGLKQVTTSKTYEDSGNYVKTKTDELGRVTTYNNNTLTGVLNSVSFGGTTTNYEYDGFERNVVKVKVGSSESNYSYDKSNRLTSVINGTIASGTEYQFTYDFRGQLLDTKLKTGTNALQTLVSNSYDDFTGFLTKTTYPNGSIGYEYDKDGNIIKQKKNDSDAYSFAYDNYGNLGLVKDLTNNTEKRYIYNTSELLEKSVNTLYNHITEYEYDSQNRKINELHSIGNDKVYNGVTYASGATDVRNNESNIASARLQVKPGGVNPVMMQGTFRYDALNRLTQEKVLKGTTEGTSYTKDYTYYDYGNHNTTHRIKKISHGFNEGSLTENIYYDNRGNITSILGTKSFNTGNVGIGQVNTNYTKMYQYDEKDQITIAQDTYYGDTYEYTYDDNGNILTEKKNGQLNFTYYYDGVNKDRLTKVTPASMGAPIPVEYDGMGNIKYDPFGGGTLSWTAGKELVSSNNGSITYTYDENGIRTKKDSSMYETKYVLEGSRPVRVETLRKSDNTKHTFDIFYDGNENALGFIYNGTERYTYVRNALGEICDILDAKGDIAVMYKYDAYGYIKEITGKTAYIDTIGKLQPIKYKGYINDEETGYYYLQSRYYSPFLKRFISLDDTGILEATKGEILGANLYAYCNNNPTMNEDPTGYISIGTVIGMIIGFGVGALIMPIFANMLKLKGWARGIFIATGVAAVMALGGLLGYYAGKALIALYAKGGLFSKKLNQAIVRVIAKLTGGSWSQAKGNGFIIKIGKVVVRVMSSGGGRTNYFRISHIKKGAMTIAGLFSNNRGVTHIPINIKNIVKIISLIFRYR